MNVKQLYKNNFSQNVVDFRSFMRYFEPIKEDIIKRTIDSTICTTIITYTLFQSKA